MWTRRCRFPAVIGTIAVAFAVVAWLSPTARPPASSHEGYDRRTALKDLVASTEAEAGNGLARYVPKVQGTLDDLSLPAHRLLAGLPGVAQVEQGLMSSNPSRRIIHIRDWHYVPKNLYARDLATSLGRQLSEDEVARHHAELLLEVEAVQAEQIAVLRCLIRHHGLRRVYCEGLTPAGLTNYGEQIRVLKEMEAEQIPALKKQLADVQELLGSMKGKESTDRYMKAAGIEAEIVGMLNDHKLRLLEIGAAGRLLVAGEFDKVMPLDDEAALDASRPVTPDGRVRLDKVKVQAREEAQVRLLLAGDAVAVIILGGDHDLSQPLRSLSEGRAEYLRVTTSMFRRFSSQ